MQNPSTNNVIPFPIQQPLPDEPIDIAKIITGGEPGHRLFEIIPGCFEVRDPNGKVTWELRSMSAIRGAADSG